MVRSAGDPEPGTRHLGAAFAFAASAGFGAVLVTGFARAARADVFIVLPAAGPAIGLLAAIMLAALAIGFLEGGAATLDAPAIRILRRLRAGFYRRFRRGRSLPEARNAFAGLAIALVALGGVALFVVVTTLGIGRWLVPIAVALTVYVNLRVGLVLCRFARFDPVWCAMLGLSYGFLVLPRFL